MGKTVARGAEQEEIDACVEAAVGVAAAHGVDCERATVLSSSSNIVIALEPTGVVARVGYRMARVWPDGGARRMSREVELARWLAERGAAVVAPSPALPAGVHECGERHLTFWGRAEKPERTPRFAPVAEELRRLHEALAGYDGPELGRLVPILDYIPLLTDQLEMIEAVDADRLALLRESFDRLSATILELDLAEQPLHGDPHPGNLMCSAEDGALLFIDFEDCCTGPVHWDVASLVGASPRALETALDAYGDSEIDPHEVRPFIEARALQAAAWLALRTHHAPRWRPRSELSFEQLEKIEREAGDG